MKYVLVFLVLCSCVFAVDNWIINGRGTGVDASVTNAGIYTRQSGNNNWAAIQDVDGGPIDTDSGGAVSDDGGNVNIAKTGAFTNTEVGNWIYVNFTSYQDGRYKVFSRTDNDVTIAMAFSGAEPVTGIFNVGGALPNPGDIPQSQSGTERILAAGDKVWVRGQTDYTTVHASDSLLYITVPGSITAPIIWEGHFAEILNEKGDFGIVTFDAQNAVTNCIETAVGGVVSHVFIGFSLERAIDDGANLNGEIDDYVTFIRCQFVNNGAWGVQGDNNINAVFCDFDTNGAGGMDCDYYSRATNCVFRTNTGDGLVGGLNMTVTGCLAYDNTDTGITVGGYSSIYGCTVDGDDGAGTVATIQHHLELRLLDDLRIHHLENLFDVPLAGSVIPLVGFELVPFGLTKNPLIIQVQ